MVTFDLNTESGVLTLQPQGPLAAGDFAKVTAAVDPFIEAHGNLKAVVIESAHFPGWENFGALASHLRFVRNHHNHVRKIAIVTDSPLATIMEHLGSHFVGAGIRHFPAGQSAEAKEWAAA